jgi:hypothetical protein
MNDFDEAYRILKVAHGCINMKQCKNCPYRDLSKDWHGQSKLKIIERITKKFNGVHACHKKTEDMEPKNDNEICIGHQQYLKELS